MGQIGWYRSRLRSIPRTSGRNEQTDENPTHLDFTPCAVNPFGVIGKTIYIGKCLESLFDFTGNIEDTTVTVHEVRNRWRIKIIGGIVKDGIVPSFEVWILSDEAREGNPFIGRGNKPRSVRTNVCRRWIGRLEGLLRP